MRARTKILFLFCLSAIVLSACQQSVTDNESNPIKRDGAAIDYHVYGDGGATLLFVHGAYADQTYWDAQVKHFSPDYKVVTFDLPGHGKSGKERPFWTVQGFSEDVYAIIKKLHLKNVILIGHSLGGDINMMTAISHPKNIIGFIGIDNFKNAATPLSKKDQKKADAMMYKLRKDFAATNEQYARLVLVGADTPPEITERVAASFRSAYPTMGNHLMPQFFELYEAEKRLLPQLRHKLHLINVDNTPTNETPLKQYAKAGYEILHLKGTSHYPMLENPEALNRLLQQSIDEIARENDAAER